MCGRAPPLVTRGMDSVGEFSLFFSEGFGKLGYESGKEGVLFIRVSFSSCMTAKDLLYKILDYRYLWILPQNRGSKPATLRLEQIESLLEAFGLTKKSANPFLQKDYSMLGVKQKLGSESYLNETVSLDYLVSGYVLRDRDNDEHTELSRKVIETIAALYPEMEDYINQRPINIQWLFSDLLSFRQEVYQLTYPNGGMLEGFSAGLHYSFYFRTN